MVEIVDSGGHHTVPDPCDGIVCGAHGTCVGAATTIGTCSCTDDYTGAMCDVAPIPPSPPSAPGGRTVGATYQYTSFEEPASFECAATSQADCGNAAMKTIGADCASVADGTACAVASLGGIAGSGPADTSAGFVTEFVSTGEELGFATYWEPCAEDGSGLSGVACNYGPNDDEDNVGVVPLGKWGSAGDNGNDVLHGEQVYMMDDADGFVYTTLDSVDLAAMANPVVSIWTHIDSTSYESKDAIRVWATCSDGTTIDVVSGVLDDEAHPTGADGQQLTENLWVPHLASLAGCGVATLSFGCQSNSNSEECWFDLIEFYDQSGGGTAEPTGPAKVVVSELMYNPPGDQGSDNQYEYMEVRR